MNVFVNFDQIDVSREDNYISINRINACFYITLIEVLR